MSLPKRGTSLRAKSIINRCQAGGYLHKSFIGREIAYFVEPGSTRVAAQYATEAINSGWLTPRGGDLFGDSANAQTWTCAPRPTPNPTKHRGVRR